MTLDLDAYIDSVKKPPAVDGIALRLLTEADIQSVAAVYPEELRSAMTDSQVLKLIRQRYKSRIPAFLAVDANERVLGASWCLDIKRSSIRRIPELGDRKGYESVSTFLVPQARGKGIAAALKHYSMKEMHHQGFKYVANQIRSDRVASIRMNESLGFRTTAIEDRNCVLGVRWVRAYF